MYVSIDSVNNFQEFNFLKINQVQEVKACVSEKKTSTPCTLHTEKISELAFSVLSPTYSDTQDTDTRQSVITLILELIPHKSIADSTYPT